MSSRSSKDDEKKRSRQIAWDHPPTRWWRLLPPSDFHPDAIRAMRSVASQVEFFGEPRWRAAVAGDAASAIAIVLSMKPKGPFRQKFDLAMTALAACACEGNAAACVVIGNIILNLSRGSDKESDLADAWARLASFTLQRSMSEMFGDHA
ncbi:hypothetical protein [Bradyrhizobium canariense]|uniref:hypothetical protein n=1 Tax=Bradyrhizobium canariense TaxID=255045 RepID=UPI00117737C3|nr:hypothetical protein [Bradyrhizobium canariense]